MANTSSNQYANMNNSTFKRQLTATNQYDDEELINDDDNNPFILVTGSKRKQQKLNDKGTIQMNVDDDHSATEHHAASTSVKHGGRIYVNSNKATNRNDHMFYDKRSADMSHHPQHWKERENRDRCLPNSNNPDINNAPLPNRNSDVQEKGRRSEEYVDLNVHQIRISQHALNYAVEQHLPPIHINCSPKLKDHQKGEGIIKGLFTHIEEDFRKLNKHYNLPLGFEYWFIDKKGDITCYTKHTELFVYLCDPRKYPTSLLSTDILPSPPKHLPSHHTLVLKYVPNDITIEEINEKLNLSIDSIFNLEEMIGSKTDRSRHLRLEVRSTTDYNQLLHRGGVTIGGRLIEVHEFLAPPRLLICSKCNEPGHIRRNCQWKYDACRRCGQDRAVGEHKDCTINCHRCKQNHLSTDYKCPYLIEYRKSLILQLKRNPHLLPPNIQIFVPTDYRVHGNPNNKTISNPISMNVNNHQNGQIHLNKSQQIPFNLNAHAWPSAGTGQSNNMIDSSGVESVWDELKKKQIEIDELKQDFNAKMQQTQSKYDENVKKLKEILSIVSTQTRCQNENIGRCYETLNEYSFLLSSTFDVFKQFTLNFIVSDISDQNKDKSHEMLQHITKSINCIQERNALLIANQLNLNKLIEQQGQLLIHAISTLELNNE